MKSQETTSVGTAYADYAETLERGFTAARIVITADTINGRGSVLFGNLLAAQDAMEGYAVIREALDAIEAFVAQHKPGRLN